MEDLYEFDEDSLNEEELDEAEYMQYAGGINDLKMLADTVSTLSQTPGGVAMMLGTPAIVGAGGAAGAGRG